MGRIINISTLMVLKTQLASNYDCLPRRRGFLVWAQLLHTL